MTFLDITKSAYIFRQQLTLEAIEILGCAGIIVYLLFRLDKKDKEHSRDLETGKTIVVILLIVCFYFLCFFPLLKKTLALQRNGIEIEGKTIQWVYRGEGDHDIAYSFEVNDEIFTSQCEIVYWGSEIENIKCPDGIYIVIYDRNDPTNSIMDLRRPIKQGKSPL